MKRIIALLLAALFTAALLTACGGKKSKTGSASQTEKATEAVTEAATEEETEAPSEEETEKPAATDTEFIYTDPAGVYELTVPVIWNDTGLILSETDADGNECVRFVYKAAYEQGAGHVFTVILSEDPSKFVDINMLPHAEEIFNDGSRQVSVMYPTDVQFAPYAQPNSDDFNKQSAEYGVLNDTKQGIIDSFRFVE